MPFSAIRLVLAFGLAFSDGLSESLSTGTAFLRQRKRLSWSRHREAANEGLVSWIWPDDRMWGAETDSTVEPVLLFLAPGQTHHTEVGFGPAKLSRRRDNSHRCSLSHPIPTSGKVPFLTWDYISLARRKGDVLMWKSKPAKIL